jgi:hypothetical protein
MALNFCEDHDRIWDDAVESACPACQAMWDRASAIIEAWDQRIISRAALRSTLAIPDVGMSVFTSNPVYDQVRFTNSRGEEVFRIDDAGNIYAYGRLCGTDLEVLNAARAIYQLPPIEAREVQAGPPKSRFQIIDEE